MISIVTGTLNRKSFLPGLIKNTVEANDKIELVLVDGGSTDGTLEYLHDYINSKQNSRIKLIEVGERSPYPHFMNLGIKNSSNEIVCQWNDDVLLVNNWDEVISEINDEYDFYLFNWKYGSRGSITNPAWVKGENASSGWFLSSDHESDIVMNYGLYKKKIFRSIGMYNNDYSYYFADADMSFRAFHYGYKIKELRNIKVCSITTGKVAKHFKEDKKIYEKNKTMILSKQVSDGIEIL